MLIHRKIQAVLLCLLFCQWLTANTCAEVLRSRESVLQDAAISERTNYYSKFVKSRQIGKKQIVKTGEGKEEITFLGTIKDRKGKTLFYVLAMYSVVKAAITVHGHSNIIYLDSEKKLLKQFSVGLREELPFKLENNALHFYYVDATSNKKKVFVNDVGMSAPKIMCVAPDNCY